MHRPLAVLTRPSEVRVLGVAVGCHDRQSALERLVVLHDTPHPASCFFVNAHSINMCRQFQEYFDAVHRADLVLNDGVGLDLAARLHGASFPDNLNGTDLTPELLATANERRWSVYLLGGRPGVAEQAASALSVEFPHIRFCGAHHGYIEGRETDIATTINRTRPDLLLVGMGNPRQEIFIDRVLRTHLSNVRLAIGVGAYLDFAAGRVPRAPRAIRALRLEWMWRLIQEPRRMWRRYLVGNWSFVFWILVDRVRRRRANERHLEWAGADRVIDLSDVTSRHAPSEPYPAVAVDEVRSLSRSH